MLRKSPVLGGVALCLAGGLALLGCGPAAVQTPARTGGPAEKQAAIATEPACTAVLQPKRFEHAHKPSGYPFPVAKIEWDEHEALVARWRSRVPYDNPSVLVDWNGTIYSVDADLPRMSDADARKRALSLVETLRDGFAIAQIPGDWTVDAGSTFLAQHYGTVDVAHIVLSLSRGQPDGPVHLHLQGSFIPGVPPADSAPMTETEARQLFVGQPFCVSEPTGRSVEEVFLNPCDPIAGDPHSCDGAAEKVQRPEYAVHERVVEESMMWLMQGVTNDQANGGRVTWSITVTPPANRAAPVYLTIDAFTGELLDRR